MSAPVPPTPTRYEYSVHWQDRLHSNEVKNEFATLYKLKIILFLEEILSIIVTPFLLWFSLPKCSDQIIDFFREFTIHVDGVGYVCSFAVFEHANMTAGTVLDWLGATIQNAISLQLLSAVMGLVFCAVSLIFIPQFGFFCLVFGIGLFGLFIATAPLCEPFFSLCLFSNLVSSCNLGQTSNKCNPL